jgi:hypothetical protein
VATNTGNQIVSGINAGLNHLGLPSIARDVASGPVAHAASGPIAHEAQVVNQNITVPDANFSIGAVYYWRLRQTYQLSSCSHDTLVSALSARDVARVSAAGGRTGVQVRVGYSGPAPPLFVITGVTAAPDVIVMGPDRRAIRVAYRVFGRGKGETVTLEETAPTGQVATIATLQGSRGTVTWIPSASIGSFKRLLIAVVKRTGVQLAVEPLLFLNLQHVVHHKPVKHKHGKILQ